MGLNRNPCMHFLLDPCKHFVRSPRVGFIAPLETAKGKTFMRKKNPPLETRSDESLREGILILTLLLEQRACPIRGRLRGQMLPPVHRGDSGV